jgi:hypothetical protein
MSLGGHIGSILLRLPQQGSIAPLSSPQQCKAGHWPFRRLGPHIAAAFLCGISSKLHSSGMCAASRVWFGSKYMANQELTTPNVWQALDHWAAQLKAWQRRILVFATRGGTLTSDQIDAVHQLFLAESNLCEPQAGCEASLEVSGRPAEALTRSLHLRRIDALCGVNALPDGSALTFAPGLTVIYGRNGAGKTGFARVIANACFSRHRPEILPNIYESGAARRISAAFHMTVDGVAQAPVAFDPDTDQPELRRISFFDTTVARLRVSETAAFEFKLSGFDVFPEMVRVYGEIGKRIDAEIAARALRPQGGTDVTAVSIALRKR